LAGKSIVQVNEDVGRYKMIKHLYPWWFSPDTGAGSWKRRKVLLNPRFGVFL